MDEASAEGLFSTARYVDPGVLIVTTVGLNSAWGVVHDVLENIYLIINYEDLGRL